MHTKDELTDYDRGYEQGYKEAKEVTHNSFGGLVEACKDAKQLLGWLPFKNGDTEKEIVEGRRKLRQAIAKAEE